MMSKTAPCCEPWHERAATAFFGMPGLVIALWCIVGAAHAADYPTRVIRVLVPYPPGGAVDNVSRLLMPKLAVVLGQQVVIDNRPGASGIIAADAVAKSAPDGYTLLHDASAHSINPSLHKLPYDTLKDFTPITLLVVNPNLLVVHPSVPVKTVRDLIKLAKAHPGQITYASSGVGSSQHMSGALFEYMTKTALVHVPYKGGGPVYSDLIGGHVQMFFANIASALVHVKSGKLRGIAVTSARHSVSAPEFPTFAESGVPGYDVYEWHGLFGPAGMPKETVSRLSSEMARILVAADIKERFFQLGAEAAPGAPEGLADFVRAEVDRKSVV
jgi:tripartite-type tricarboxylate transporter receptor subunit TctC